RIMKAVIPEYLRLHPRSATRGQIIAALTPWAPSIDGSIVSAGLRELVTEPVYGLRPKAEIDRQGIKAWVYTSVQGSNADLLANVSALYFNPGDRIADVSYGKGAFWRQVDLSQFHFFASDLLTCPNALYDFRRLPSPDNDFDVVVLDPPY